MDNSNFKIIGLKVDGIRKLSAVEMKFAESGLIQIRGKNGQGKTSIIDSLEILLSGAKHIEPDMINHEKEKAEIIARLGEYEIKRVITNKSNRLEIKNKDGLVIKEKPQAFLDKLINTLTFNPRPFLAKSPGDKLKFMMELLKIDFTDIEKEIKIEEEERLILGRQLKGCGDIAKVEKVEKVDISALLRQRDNIIGMNEREKEEYQKKRETAIADVYEYNSKQTFKAEQIEETEKGISGLQKQIKILQKRLEMQTKVLKTLPLPEQFKNVEDIKIELPAVQNTAELDAKIESAEETNVKAEGYQKYLNLKTIKADIAKQYEIADNKIKKLRQEKLTKLKEAKTPVEGLEIKEDGIYHNGIYSENWGEAESLRISSELCLGMNPALRAVFIDKGEAYDINNLKQLQEWAIKNDIQAFITIVDSAEGHSEGDVFYLEEGKII